MLVHDITIEQVLFDGLPLEELVASISAFYDAELQQNYTRKIAVTMIIFTVKRHITLPLPCTNKILRKLKKYILRTNFED